MPDLVQDGGPHLGVGSPRLAGECRQTDVQRRPARCQVETQRADRRAAGGNAEPAARAELDPDIARLDGIAGAVAGRLAEVEADVGDAGPVAGRRHKHLAQLGIAIEEAARDRAPRRPDEKAPEHAPAAQNAAILLRGIGTVGHCQLRGARRDITHDPQHDSEQRGLTRTRMSDDAGADPRPHAPRLRELRVRTPLWKRHRSHTRRSRSIRTALPPCPTCRNRRPPSAPSRA